MSRSEHPLIWYYEQDRRFAELMNGWNRRLREFPPELCAMFLFIKYREQPQELMRKLSGMEIEEDTLEAVADYVGERRLKQFQPERKGGTVNVCRAIDILVADGEKKGFRRGVAQERKKTERERKNAEQERRRADAEYKRAEQAEARVRELERMLAL